MICSLLLTIHDDGRLVGAPIDHVRQLHDGAQREVVDDGGWGAGDGGGIAEGLEVVLLQNQL